MPLQALVNNSQLRLHAHSKVSKRRTRASVGCLGVSLTHLGPSHLIPMQASLLGFYDPCIGEPKQLHIVYLFRRRRHEVVVNDLDEVALPMRCACLC